MILSAGAAAVLFLGTTAGILASQGRLGSLFGKKAAEPVENAGENGAESRPEGEAADITKKIENTNTSDKNKNADAAGNTTNTGDKQKTEGLAKPAVASMLGESPKSGSREKGIETKDNKNGDNNKSAAPSDVKKSEKTEKNERSAGEKEPKNVKESSGGDEVARANPPIPKRGATASLVTRFTLPSPFTPEELESLVNDLRASRESFEKLQSQAAYEKAANERDRLEIETSYAKLTELRSGLDQQKKEVVDKVSDLSKRADALAAGELNLVKSIASRIKDLDISKIQTQLFDFDMRIAAQVVLKLDPKKQGDLLASMTADKRVPLQKALEAITRLGADAATAKPGAKDNSK